MSIPVLTVLCADFAVMCDDFTVMRNDVANFAVGAPSEARLKKEAAASSHVFASCKFHSNPKCI